MKQHVLTFPEFVVENRRYVGSPTLFSRYTDVFGDLDFEDGVVDEIRNLEQKYLDLKSEFWWNRDTRSMRDHHFAVNVKVYVWPEDERVREITGKPEMSDEEINDKWWTWMNDVCDGLIEDITGRDDDGTLPEYSWIQKAGFGGKSGGWLLLVPKLTDSDVEEWIEEQCHDYEMEKKPLKDSGDLQLIADYLHDNEYRELAALNLTPELKEVKKLQDMVNQFRAGMSDNLRYLQRMETDMRTIQERVKKFTETALADFYEYLQDEKDMNL